MNKQSKITSIPETIAELKALGSVYAASLSNAHNELIDHFERLRERLYQHPAMDWEAETELKAAYEYGLDLLEKAHGAYVDEFRRNHQ